MGGQHNIVACPLERNAQSNAGLHVASSADDENNYLQYVQPGMESTAMIVTYIQRQINGSFIRLVPLASCFSMKSNSRISLLAV